MPMTREEIAQGEARIIKLPGSRRLYLIPGKEMGMKIPMSLVALTEQEWEDQKRVHAMVIEIGDAHPDLVEGIEWEVTGIRRLDLVNLPGHPLREKGDDEVDSGLQSG